MLSPDELVEIAKTWDTNDIFEVSKQLTKIRLKKQGKKEIRYPIYKNDSTAEAALIIDGNKKVMFNIATSGFDRETGDWNTSSINLTLNRDQLKKFGQFLTFVADEEVKIS